ncbi:hypothetical protein MKUB_30040 [Mycobacterium kubicae]|uniref:Polyketide cyclase n=1 Tax=Mycobacterium kubicae TaxID=120959 RepID=A0AAX1JA82_9MYCO|nr:hypothetical protein [Mycobacterium kubicae]MCV7094256.1 hypothetical protein [Mycobacterium kubicae]ORV98914.1 hypothetical protein AWC13_11970 [Mycobacterium kubicae]QNI09935.1 hypothetical protein GAN18_00675 [Mycobacterium kubicae]QPI38132.1 hypothetical protein I2456_00635 [Mycobacterium kubicae]GFG65514.1 hypothetical protein MKUB_30040 [Mycobacterium kubicae]
MTELPPPGSAARRFIDDITLAGSPVRVEPGRLMYEVLAIGGALSGLKVETGVSQVEVENWPLVPPHWVHLRDSVVIENTNTDTTDCPPGWRRHSREFAFTDTSVPPATAWLRHVRGVLSLAVTAA